MSDIAIQIENLSKAYQLGKIGTGTISRDFERFFATRILGKEDPFLKIGQTNDRSVKGTSDIVWSLKDIDFSVNQGDAVGIIGKNGAGKSTLLKILSRVTSPTSGSAKIKGRVSSLLEVGTGFHAELSGRENIYLNGAILGMRKAEIKRKFDEIVDFSGVERYIDTPVKRYSSGMYVRLAFAVAAHLESEILIVDEVLAVGDAEFQKKCLGKMGDISKGEGRTILFVSHNMSAVKNLCDKGIVLENGQVIYQGTSENSAEFYLSKNVSKSDVLLSDRDDRKGDGRLKITNVLLKNKAGYSVTDLILGESCSIQFDYSVFGTIKLNEFTMVVQIVDQSENVVTTFGSDEMGYKFLGLSEKGSITINIDRLNLRSGNYFVNFMFSEKKSFNSPHNIVDFLSNSTKFTVLSSDVYHSGVMLRSGGYIQDFSIDVI